MKNIFSYCFFISVFSIAFDYSNCFAQNQTAIGGALNVFLDCDYCDFDFVKSEINYVNFVRDRLQADVHVLITNESTGSGGTIYTLFYLGQNNFQNENDTLRYTANTTNTSDETRNGLTQILSIGLMRYIAHTSQADKISFRYEIDSTVSEEKKDTVDPWRSWVFSIYGSGHFNKEVRTDSRYFYGEVSADRVTEKMKLNFSVGADISMNKFQIDDTTEYESNSHSEYTNLQYVKSLSPHWSLGGGGGYSTSTYSNIKRSMYAGPAIEYDVFPYSEASRRLLSFYYELDFYTAEYYEETIYDKTSETVAQQKLITSLSFTQPWGSTSVVGVASSFLNDFSKNKLQLSMSTNIRLFQGLSLRLGGSIAFIHDQVSLPKYGASQEEVLLQIKQLQTDYRYNASIGISYEFGSIYNNIVNPRFDGGSITYYY